MSERLAHGASKYTNDACRCAVCREAWASYQRGLRRRRRDEGAGGGFKTPHGTTTGYQQYLCRCDACRHAAHINYVNRRTRKERPMDFKDRMIESYERGECSYEGAYDHVHESLADAADQRRKAEKEGPLLSPEKTEEAPRAEDH